MAPLSKGGWHFRVAKRGENDWGRVCKRRQWRIQRAISECRGRNSTSDSEIMLFRAPQTDFLCDQASNLYRTTPQSRCARQLPLHRGAKTHAPKSLTATHLGGWMFIRCATVRAADTRRSPSDFVQTSAVRRKRCPLQGEYTYPNQVVGAAICRPFYTWRIVRRGAEAFTRHPIGKKLLYCNKSL